MVSLRNSLFVFVLFTFPIVLSAFQEKDSLTNSLTVSTGTLLSTGSNAPFWLTANNSQRVSNESKSIWTDVLLEKEFNKESNWSWGYGLELIARFDGGWSGDFTQAYIKGKSKHFQIYAGRKEEILGVVDSTLSIGSLANGNNALPIPKIVIRSNGWVDVPFTDGWVQFNAYYSHGWLERDRFIQNALLHQKYFYLNVGAKWPINAYGGIVFNTQWGGTRSDNGEKQPSSLKDYLRIIRGTAGGGNASSSDQQNALGNHLGTWEIGATADLRKWRILQYWQFVWEDRSGLTPFNWRDGMMGISVKRKNQNHWFTGFNLEIVRTTSQNAQKIGSDGVPFLEPNDYFNNTQYSSGWTYKDIAISNPIFLVRDELNSRRNSIANRINAVNIGVEGQIMKGNLFYQLKYTYFKNQGRFTDAINPPFKVYSFNTLIKYQINSRSNLETRLSFDNGNSIKNNLGIYLKYSQRIF